MQLPKTITTPFYATLIFIGIWIVSVEGLQWHIYVLGIIHIFICLFCALTELRKK